MTVKKKLIIGSDHAGFRLKKIIVAHLADSGFEVEDAGCESEKSCDYPVFGKRVAETVARGNGGGILLCGTGIGMSMVANKVPGVRAALACSEYAARMAKRHNNANVLVIGARVTGDDLALSIVDSWLNTEFEGGRHQRRLDMFGQ